MKWRMAVLDVVAALLLVLPTLGQDQQRWKVQQGKSEMTDERFASIMTLAEGSSENLGGALGILCYSNKVDVGVYTEGADYQPQPMEPLGFSWRWAGKPTTKSRIRFDSNKPATSWWVLSEPKLMVSYGVGTSGKSLVKKLLGAKQFRIEYTTLTGRTQVFTFEVSGLRDQIARVPDCKIE